MKVKQEKLLFGRDLPLFVVLGLVFYTLYFVAVWVYSFYWVRMFWSRDGSGFKGRKRDQTWMCVRGLLVYMFARWYDGFLSPFGSGGNEGSWLDYTLTLLRVLLTMGSFIVAGESVCLRLWLIYFDASLAATNSENQWTALIDAPVGFTPVIHYNPNMIMYDVNSKTVTVDELPGNWTTDWFSSPSLVMNPSLARQRSVSYAQSSVHRLGLHKSKSRKSLSFGINMMNHTKKKSEEDSQEISKENWFFAYRSVYGNPRWWIKRERLTVIVTVSLVSAGSCLGLDWLTHAMAFLVSCVFGGLLFTINYGIPPFTDSLKVRSEISLFLRFCLVLLTIGSILIISDFIVDEFIFDDDNGDKQQKKQSDRQHFGWIDQVNFVFNMLSNGLYIYFSSLLLLVQTKWVYLTFVIIDKEENETDIVDVPLQSIVLPFGEYIGCSIDHPYLCYLKSNDHALQLQRQNQRVKKNRPDLEQVQSQSQESKWSRRQLTVREVLEDETGFRHFMNHLFSELSYESLVCVVEMTQFAERFGENTMVSQDSEEILKGNTDSFDPYPQSKSMEFPLKQVVRNLTSSVRLLSPVDNRTASLRESTSDVKEDEDTSAEDLTTQKSISQRKTDRSLKGNNTLLDLPPSVQRYKSSIVWHSKMSKEQIFCVLCQKYIVHDAEMSVNISHSLRVKLEGISNFLMRGTLPPSLHSNQYTPQLYEELKQSLSVDSEVFKPVVRMLLRLMRDSMQRFQATQEYSQLKQSLYSKLNET